MAATMTRKMMVSMALGSWMVRRFDALRRDGSVGWAAGENPMSPECGSPVAARG
jgi:hypothetical protein